MIENWPSWQEIAHEIAIGLMSIALEPTASYLARWPICIGIRTVAMGVTRVLAICRPSSHSQSDRFDIWLTAMLVWSEYERHPLSLRSLRNVTLNSSLCGDGLGRMSCSFSVLRARHHGAGPGTPARDSM